jgi:hypothetical protein
LVSGVAEREEYTKTGPRDRTLGILLPGFASSLPGIAASFSGLMEPLLRFTASYRNVRNYPLGDERTYTGNSNTHIGGPSSRGEGDNAPLRIESSRPGNMNSHIGDTDDTFSVSKPKRKKPRVEPTLG